MTQQAQAQTEGPQRAQNPGGRRVRRLAAPLAATVAFSLLTFASVSAATMAVAAVANGSIPGPGQTAPKLHVNRAAPAATTTSDTVTTAQSRGVVLIDTELPTGTAAGTGMVVNADGLILTNYHVVQGSTAIEVTIVGTRRTYKATLVGHDATDDVALLKIPVRDLATVTIDTDPVTVGAAVTAVGNANGQGFLTAAAGAVLDTSRDVQVANDSTNSMSTLRGVYVTNAGAQPGDSGGPLFDSQTEVTAMTSAGEQSNSRTGTTTVASYAIPIAKALSIVNHIRAGVETTDVRIGPNAYLGISASPTTSGGVEVVSAVTGGPAAKAGITAGSTITALAGRSVSGQSGLASLLGTHNPGDKVSVSWIDPADQARTAQVTLGTSPIN